MPWVNRIVSGQESSAALLEAIECAEHASCIVGEDGEILYANRAFCARNRL